MCLLKVKVISLPYIFQVLYVLCFTRPRYQVSIYRTNGPLVSSTLAIFLLFLSHHCFHSSHIYEMGFYDFSSKEN